MTTQRPDPLTPEERELAERLGRIGPRGTPSADLDARILGAAHAAAGRKAGPARSRSRWPALVGVAATLALAVGVVWQLRPLREVPAERDETPISAMVRSPAAAAAPEKATPVQESDLPRPAESRAADIAAPVQPPQPPQPQLRMLSPPAPKPLPPVVFDDPSPIDTPEPAPPPAPPAPPAPAAPSVSTPVRAAAQAADRPAAVAQARYPVESRAAATQRKATAGAPADSTAEDAQAGFNIQANTPQRTVTIADVPVDRDRLLDPVDWIERIRQRRDSGDLDSARASLDALREAHPALALPDDILAIAITAEARPGR